MTCEHKNKVSKFAWENGIDIEYQECEDCGEVFT